MMPANGLPANRWLVNHLPAKRMPGGCLWPMQPDSKLEPPAQFTIRPMIVEDLEQVVAIDQMSFSLPWPAHSFRYELLENDVSRLWVATINPAGTEAYPAGASSNVIGMIVVWLIMDEAHIATIAVHPKYRGRGIGRQILIAALRECVAQGAQSATLEVREHNVIAIDMYRKLGFDVVGRRKHYYQDTNEDAILMTLESQGLERITRPTGGIIKELWDSP
jgi:ribosomal-protein-alanine N-acetyltransferase